MEKKRRPVPAKSGSRTFLPGFAWGSATAAYQIEGAWDADGKGPSTWDMFCDKDGAVWKGQSGREACDHYHRWRDDISLMKNMGANAYRFSIAWARVMPEGTGPVNGRGLDFYDRLVDGLLAKGIAPWVTLFHWDYPLALYHRGGWLNPDSPRWFADYARVMVDRLSDRVSNWMTHNEPPVFILLGHQVGFHAPGDRLGWAQVLRAQHNAYLAHGRAVQVIRAHAKLKPSIGVACVTRPMLPASPAKRDIDAARREQFTVPEKGSWSDAWWIDPLYLGRYPEDGVRIYGKAMPKATREDMALIGQPLDFLGVNNYQSTLVEAGPDGKPRQLPFPVGHPITALKWVVAPGGLYWGTKFYQERYKVPIVVTENGQSGADWVMLDGKVHDGARVDHLARYLSALRAAHADGVDIRGYFHWSLMDNFEWAEGYKERFGLIHVDYTTQKRTPKDSYYYYRRVIRSNGACLPRYKPFDKDI